MIDANSQFFAILTNVGMAKQANADALGIPWLITQMGVGDANPNGLADPPNPVPSASQTKLLNEWRRKPLNQLKIDPVNSAVIIAEQIILADEGGKWIREIGLYDADGDLVAVANCAPSFKPLLSQGSGRTQIVRMNFIVTSTGNIQLKIDPAIVLASRAYVDAAILEVLPKNKTPGEFTRVKVNDRGIVVSGDNPDTLAKMGIKDSYTKAEIESMIAQASALPVGATVAFPLDKVAPGFLELDGSVKSIAVYPDLAAFLGTAFNKGDEGAGNFRLPESRGEFLRGWDHGRGVDAGRAVGSWQVGTATYGDGDGLNLPIPNLNNPAHVRVLGLEYDSAPAVVESVTVNTTPSAATPLNMDGVQAPGTAYVGVDFMRSRPRNIAVVWCIKAWNAPINQGNIDIAALEALATQATEIKLGTAKIATKAQTDAGTDDATIVTPKKLRLGFLASLTPNGYVAFPSWLGGFTIQWGLGSYVDKTPISFTLAYANDCFVVLATDGTVATAVASDVVTYGAAPDTLSKTGFLLRSSLGGIGGNVFWLSVGK
ncbi:phage tail protein [Pseudomonas sp. N40(2020)]|uniref:phage tail protein n=1 Tax=Pseudomonas sp. N40(2020) TaxID=2767798 RepID=UPI0016572297|nr:phage tail protein [Pseudomonas sp. N40(2020)]MBC8994983.1 phage tail protein [Pseudomonas sp. N40(2020)]